jgi:hypothetical protein
MAAVAGVRIEPNIKNQTANSKYSKNKFFISGISSVHVAPSDRTISPIESFGDDR